MADEEQTNGVADESLQVAGDEAAHLEQVEEATEGAANQEAPALQDDLPAESGHAAAYNTQDDSDSGIDFAVVIIVLLVALGCLIGALVTAMNAPKPSSSQAQTVAEQEAQARAEAEEEANRIEVAELSEGVAAVVNGEEILEVEITENIEVTRVDAGLDDEDTWGEWLAAMGMSAEDVRETVIRSYISQALIEQAAAELGVEVTDEQVEEAYQQSRSQFESDEEWEQALQMAGYTEETFREQCAQGVMQDGIMVWAYEHSEDIEPVTDEAVLEGVKTYFSDYAEATSLDEVGAEEADKVRSMLENNVKLQAFEAYMDTFKEQSDIKMSKMPSDASYNIFLLPYYFTAMMQQSQSTDASTASN